MNNVALTMLVAVVASLPSIASAEDVSSPGRKLSMKSTDSSQALALTASDAAVPAPARGGDEDPTLTGASLTVRNPQTGESSTFILPAALWSASSTGDSYKFKNPQAPAGASPVRAARIKAGSLKVKARSTGITLDEASQGSVALSLASGTLRVCVRFGGDVTRDEPGRFSARNAPAPQSCDDGPATTSTTTTLATTTTTSQDPTTTLPTTTTTVPVTTTTLPLPTICGDLSIDG
ncbi:MAG TPA: hypothetical protein VEL28_02830, partial [Candidatus Binatia bacterium]|nr:hypothetical protein [Candidatus Binatia bacterium]